MYFPSLALLCDNGRLLCDNDRQSRDNNRLWTGQMACVDHGFSNHNNFATIGLIIEILVVLIALIDYVIILYFCASMCDSAGATATFAITVDKTG